MSNIDRGRRGEETVCRLLTDRGYRILERNLRYHHFEVDIVAAKDDVLVFVEVKTRKSGDYGKGLESITREKQRRIIAVARYYIQRKELHDYNVRFDVASIDGNDLRYIESAFQV